MNKTYTLGVVATGMAIAGTLLGNVKPANALVLHNGWTYSMDAINDSSPFNRAGNGAFEIYGSAYKVDNGKVTFAINSNVNLANGVNWNSAADRKVHFGDILLNFTGKALDAANGQLFGIRFAANNDSAVSSVGVYSNVTAKEVASVNDGWASYQAYNNYILGQRITPKVGDLAYNNPYLNPSARILNSIQSGNKIGDITLLNSLSSLGLDFGYFNGGKVGSQTIAFSFDAGLLPLNEQGIYLFGMECNNDLTAGYYTEVPTPAAILPALLGMVGAAIRKKDETTEEA